MDAYHRRSYIHDHPHLDPARVGLCFVHWVAGWLWVDCLKIHVVHDDDPIGCGNGLQVVWRTSHPAVIGFVPHSDEVVVAEELLLRNLDPTFLQYALA